MLAFPVGHVWGTFRQPRWMCPTWPHLWHVGGMYSSPCDAPICCLAGCGFAGGEGLEAKADLTSLTIVAQNSLAHLGGFSSSSVACWALTTRLGVSDEPTSRSPYLAAEISSPNVLHSSFLCLALSLIRGFNPSQNYNLKCRSSAASSGSSSVPFCLAFLSWLSSLEAKADTSSNSSCFIA